MDSIKSSNTSVSAVNGYGVISYRTFSITSSGDNATGKTAELEGLSAVEARLRELKRTVILDRAKLVLWLFEPGTTPPAIDHGSLQSRELGGLQLSPQSEGEFKAVELTKAVVRPSTAGLSGPNAGNVRAIQATSARAFQNNTQASNTAGGTVETRKDDVITVYELFISAIIASISFHLSRFHHMIPLNYRTFVSFSQTTTVDENDSEDDDDVRRPVREVACQLTTLDAHLSTGGTLVISTSVKSNTGIYQLEKTVLYIRAPEDFLGELVRIAPNGMIARYIGMDDLVAASIRDGASPLRRSRYTQQWKAQVLRWLRRKGICLPEMEEGKWVRIQLQVSTRAETSSFGSFSYRECLWPAALCFVYGSKSRDNVHTVLEGRSTIYRADDQDHDGGTEWFRTKNQMGFEDPLEAAQNWVLSKDERVKAIEAKRARRAQEETAQAAAESAAVYPSSPLYSRGSAYGDPHAAQGVYPTPPDGVLAPGAGGTVGMDGIVMSSVTMEGQGTHGLAPTGAETLSLPSQGAAPAVVIPGEHHDPMSVTDAPAGGQSPGADGNDDLFEDMDEEMFGGNDVTEADFNFFDDTDGAGFGDLMDVSQPPQFEEPKNDSSPADFKFESPIAEIHNTALDQKPGISSNVEPDAEKEPTVHSADMEPTGVETKVHEAKDPSEAEQPVSEPKDDAMHVERVPTPRISPPLSPTQIQQRLFPSPHPNEGTVVSNKAPAALQKQESVFDAVGFSQRMSLTDSKYGATGRFNFPLESHPARMMEMNAKPLVLHPPPSAPSAPSLNRSITIPRHVAEDVDMSDGLSDTSDSYSDMSASIASLDESAFSAIAPLDAASVANSKRKWAPSVIATPAAGTPGGTQIIQEDLDSIMDEADESDAPPLSSLEPGPSDWSIANIPAPSTKTKRRPGTADSRTRSESYTLPSAASTPSSVGSSEAVTDLFPPPLNAKEIINITQLLADQVIPTTLDLLSEESAFTSSAPEEPSRAERIPIQTIQNAVNELFQQVDECDLLKYAQIQDAVPEMPASGKVQPKPVQRRNNPTADPHANMFFSMSTPNVRIRRGEDMWDVLPPALSFWEPLGLAPTGGPKNVLAYCVTPSSDQLNDPVESFLDNLSMAYESCKFGMHIRPPSEDDFPNGLVPAEVDHELGPSLQTCLQAMRNACARVGKYLSGVDFREWYGKPEEAPSSWNIDALVIYIVNPFADPQALWQLCSAFWTLFQAYAPSSAGKAIEARPDVVLQLVPMKYVASFNAPVVLEPSVLNRLAREVYDRCPPKAPNDEHSVLSIYKAPSIQLEEMLPKSIPFRITVEPPSDLLHENSYIHVGYAISFDGTWLTAAWTDNPGKHQATVSYCLVNRSFAEVAREIYQTSLEIMQARRVTWRLCIARAGVMEREEMDAWIALANSPCSLTIGTALISIDPSPSFAITSTIPSPTSPNTTSTQPSSTSASGTLGVSTPGTTPQPGVSPSADTQHALTPAAATPGDGNPTTAVEVSQDPDARLVDVTDESWGIILSHRLHNSNSCVEYRPALASGYLVKRGADANYINSSGGAGGNPGASGSDAYAADTPRGPIVVGVNLLWIGATGTANQRTAANINLNMNPDSAASSALPSPSATGVPPSPLTPGSVGMGGIGGGGSSGGSMSVPATHAARNTYDGVLKEFLGTYRGLGLLARLKGMRDTRGGAVPWHICAALRGVRALERCL